MAAIEEYTKHTCVKWTRWAGETDYVYFVSGNTGCWSSVGRVGGMQVILFYLYVCGLKSIFFLGIEFTVARLFDEKRNGDS